MLVISKVFLHNLLPMPPSTIRVVKPGVLNGLSERTCLATATSLLRPCDSSKVTRESVAFKGCEATLEHVVVDVILISLESPELIKILVRSNISHEFKKL